MICRYCKIVDDEDHRLNHCKTYQSINFYNETHKVDFSEVYSQDIDVLKQILKNIEKVWNTKTSNGTMNQ